MWSRVGLDIRFHMRMTSGEVHHRIVAVHFSHEFVQCVTFKVFRAVRLCEVVHFVNKEQPSFAISDNCFRHFCVSPSTVLCGRLYNFSNLRRFGETKHMQYCSQTFTSVIVIHHRHSTWHYRSTVVSPVPGFPKQWAMRNRVKWSMNYYCATYFDCAKHTRSSAYLGSLHPPFVEYMLTHS